MKTQSGSFRAQGVVAAVIESAVLAIAAMSRRTRPTATLRFAH